MDRFMVSTTRFLSSAGLVMGLGLLAAAPGTQVNAQSNALEVTSDTPAYCLRLLDRLSDLVHLAPSPPSPEVTSLSTEGQRMCDQGKTRGGILRLRRAWMLMTHPDGTAHPPAGAPAN